MKYHYGEEILYTIDPISPDDEKSLGDFDCGNESINEYLITTRKHEKVGVTYLIKDTVDFDIIGFVTISCSGIRYAPDSKWAETKPAIMVNYFALRTEYHGLPFSRASEIDKNDVFLFSDIVLSDVIKMCIEISEQRIGADYIILYSVPEKVNFYKRNLFEDYIQYMNKDYTRYLDGCVPMYLTI